MGQVIAPEKMISLEPNVLIFSTSVVSTSVMEKMSPEVLKTKIYRSSTVQYKNFYKGQWRSMKSRL
jgi:hypothetical protein